ncbi:MAG: hypothetical protein GF333_07475 [Candidatus Omnitrophica bacterium]|nr:hypothetical protein [Candidatus Omnitrophota bacterium]
MKKLACGILLIFCLPVLYAQDLDRGLRVYDDGEKVPVAVRPADESNSPLRIHTDGTTYGIELVDPTDPLATNMRINTPRDGIKAIKKYAPQPLMITFNDLCCRSDGPCCCGKKSGDCPGYDGVWVKNTDCVYARVPGSDDIRLGCNRGAVGWGHQEIDLAALGFAPKPAINVLSLKMSSTTGKTITTENQPHEWRARKIPNGYVIATNNNNDGQWRDLYFSLTLESENYEFVLQNYDEMIHPSSEQMPSTDLSPY